MYGLKLPLVRPGDDVVDLIIRCAKECNVSIDEGDVVVITSKILSKAMNLLYNVDEVKPSEKAVDLGRKSGLNPNVVELILRESDDVLLAVPFKDLVLKGVVDIRKISKDVSKALKAIELYPTMLITLRDGMLWSESGVDTSNHPPNIYSIPPRNLDKVAKNISNDIYVKIGKKVAVVICDTELFPFGSLDVARGSYGVRPIARDFGEPDIYGKPKFGGVDNVVYELCSASALLMKQATEGIPVVIVKGLSYEWFDCGLADVMPLDIKKIKKALRETLKHTVRTLGLKHVVKLLLS